MRKSLGICAAIGCFILFLFTTGCENDLNVFPVSKDMELGEQMESQIASDPAQFPLMSRTTYSTAYAHLDRITSAILNSNDLKYADKFNWTFYLVQNDTVLNAFACPGGYIYVYTGIIKFLDNEAQLAGVLAHEIAHVDKRHSTDQLTSQYGISALISIVLGKDASEIEKLVGNVAGGLTVLSFSRKHEYQADEYAVRYLYDTDYHAPALGDFFDKLEAAGTAHPPAFLSTHPNPGNRVEEIEKVWKELGGKTGQTYPDRYQEFKNSLPH